MHVHEYFHISHSVPLHSVNITFTECNVRQNLIRPKPVTVCVISLKTDTNLNYVKIFTSFVMESTFRGQRKNQLINGFNGNYPLFIVSYETYKLSGRVEG